MLGDFSTRALRNDIFPPKKGHYVYSKRSFECNSTFQGMLSDTAIGNLPETRLLSSARAPTDLQPGGYSWREAWFLTFGMGDEVVSEGGVGAGVMERGAAAAGARGCHAPRAQGQQLCGSGEAGGRTERRQRKAIRDRQGRRLRRKEKRKKALNN